MFTGSSAFCVRAFVHLVPLVSSAGLRCVPARRVPADRAKRNLGTPRQPPSRAPDPALAPAIVRAASRAFPPNLSPVAATIGACQRHDPERPSPRTRLPSSSLLASENTSDAIAWTLCQLLSQLSNAGDPAAFAALVSGAADLTEDAADALRAQPSRTRRGWPIGQHAGHGHAMVLCSFLEALRVARAAAGEEGPDTPPLERVARSAHAASAGTAPERAAPEMGLALEVSGADAADALMRAACKLLTHALRLGPQIAAGFVSPSVSRALAYAAAAPNASIATRRAALSALRSAAAEVPAATFPAEACLRAVAETMRERAGGGRARAAAGP